MSYLIFDAAVVLVLLFTAWRGYRRGFVLTLCGFLALFVALIGASVVSNALSDPVSRALQPAIERNLNSVFEGYTVQQAPAQGSSQAAGSQGEEEVILPLQEALDILKDSNLYRGFVESIQEALNEGMVSAAANAVRVIADYVATQLSRIVIFFIAFVLILVLWYFISHALDLAFRLPVLSTINHWLGAGIGLLKGAVLLFILCWLFQGSFLPPEAVRETYLLRFFCVSTPLSLLS